MRHHNFMTFQLPITASSVHFFTYPLSSSTFI